MAPFDTANVDWFIWEDVDTAHVYENDDLVPIRKEHWDAVAIAAVPGDDSRIR